MPSRFILHFLLLLLTLLGSGCNPAENQSIAPAATQPATYPASTSPPTRIVSVTVGTDELLLDLVDPSRIAALSTFVDDPYYSNVIEKANAVEQRVTTNAEQVLSLNPDLLLYASYNRPEFIKLIEAAGIRGEKIQGFDTIDQILTNISTVGRAVHEESRANDLIAQARRRIKEVKTKASASSHPSVLYYDHGWVSGSNTLADEIIRTAGGRNYAAEQKIEGTREIAREVLLNWTPDVVLIAGKDKAQLSADAVQENHREIAGMRTVKSGKVYEVPARAMTSVSHYIAEAPEIVLEILETP